MPEHKVEVIQTPSWEVVNTDLRITIDSDGEKLGELCISRGTIDWRPRDAKNTIVLEWEAFDRFMREIADR